MMSSLIRTARSSDAGAIAAIYAPAVSEHATSFELIPPDAAEMERRLLTVLQKYPWLVFESEGDVLGYAYPTAHRDRAAYRWSVDTAVYVRTDSHRRGIARSLYTALFELLVQQGYINAYAGVTLPNKASVAIHRALGFKKVGVYHRVGFKFGKWHDVAWFERELAQHVGDPPEPIPFPELAKGTDAIVDATGRLFD